MKNLTKFITENLSTGIAIVATATAGILGMECNDLNQRLDQKREDNQYLEQKYYDIKANQSRMEIDGVYVDISREQANQIKANRKSREEFAQLARRFSDRMDRDYQAHQIAKDDLEKKLAGLPHELSIWTEDGSILIPKCRATDYDIDTWRYQEAHPRNAGENYKAWSNRVREEENKKLNKK